MSFVKLCGMTRAVDVRAACELDIDAVGFVFAESRRRADPEVVAAVVPDMPPSVSSVAVFRDQPLDDVLAIVAATGVDGVQLHGSESRAYIDAVREVTDLLLVALSPNDPRLESIEDLACDAVLLDAVEPGSGSAFDWSTVGDLPTRRRVVLAGGLRPDSVAEAIAVVRPWGVDVASGVESAPGVKDHAAMARFVDGARRALAEYGNDPGPA
ncbi:MAG: phosphoribosylanthranilate isomerase [Acidobacteria bacterium]|nr:phosphoribosylanthranilate isomerase [Acidobacteriota bacterium]